MIRKTVSAAIILATLGVGAPAYADIAYEKANQQIVEAHILPGYTAFAQAGQRLKTATHSYCGEGETSLDGLKEVMQGAMASWQSIQHIRFGPIAEEDRHFRIEFWPDKRNMTSKALTSLRQDIAKGDTVDDERIAQTSVAAQGFPALERLLYGDKDIQPGSADCQLAEVISDNVAGIADATLKAWGDDGFAERSLSGFGYYQEPKDLTFELFKAFKTSLEWVEDSKLRRPLGDDMKHARSHRAESWRSATSADHILRNIDAIEAFYSADKTGGFAALLQETPVGTDLHWGILGKLHEAREAIRKIDGPLYKAVKDPAGRAHMEDAIAALREMREWVDTEMASLLEMPLGFNSLDGD